MLTIHIILPKQTNLKFLGLFENLAFVIMSTRENIRLIARASLKLPYLIYFFIIFSNNKFTLVNQISRSVQSPRKWLLALFAGLKQSLKMRSQNLSV